MKRFFKLICIVLTILMTASALPTGFVASAAEYNWAGAWGTPAIQGGITLGSVHLPDFVPVNSTLRTVVTPTIGGTKIRFKFSNLYGQDPLVINEATVAKTGVTNDVVIEESITQITFNGGYKKVTIAEGSEIYSDPINFSTTALEKISISTYHSNTTPMYTIGLYGGTTYLSTGGNKTHSETIAASSSRLDFTASSITYNTIPFLTRVDIYAEDAYSVVIIGDSTVTNEIAYNLAKKLHGNGIHNVGVVMSGIIGNALLRDGVGLLGKVYGQALLDRVKRDAFDVAGVEYVIVKIGVNDVLHPMLESNKGVLPMVTASQIIEGYKTLISMAEDEHVSMHLVTRTPFKGYERNFLGSKDLTWTQEGEDILLEVNSWVKNNATYFGYDGYIDFDALRDPEDNAQLRPHMTTDGAHFSEYGQLAAVDLIPEAAYGVKSELTDLADLLDIDPYTAPVENNSSNNSGDNTNNDNNGNTNNNNNGNGEENTTSVQNVIVPVEGTTAVVGGNADSQQGNTNNNANQIQVQNPINDQQTVSPDVSDDASRQIAGFGILAAVSIAIIVVSGIMLIKVTRRGGTSLTRGGKGRAMSKKRV